MLRLSFLVILVVAAVPRFSEDRLWKVHPEFQTWQEAASSLSSITRSKEPGII